MSSDIIRRGYGFKPSHRRNPYDRQVEDRQQALQAATSIQLFTTHCMAVAGKGAMFNILDLANTRKELELISPVAAEAIALVANTVSLAIANQVNRFCFELGN